MTVQPQRLRLSRAKGFNLQAASRELNGLSAVKVSRPSIFGNPFTADQRAGIFIGGQWAILARKSYLAADVFRWWLAGDLIGAPIIRTLEPRRQKIRQSLELLRGRNLACWCKEGAHCHADVLLELANK